ncbi:hypothetical protein NQ117_19935 [Paenibacillus sp. SC116]|uniref:hypothetical protein n=1 Tax=Paenibacillus sp. SC116 TaxID=2968986 RepID=UPI00215B2328|nr:hypothetical protein [Paenibacillus sp. SC116]MCR8845957.1 hypothetical protein [Paenibacillus sp. SC116]
MTRKVKLSTAALIIIVIAIIVFSIMNVKGSQSKPLGSFEWAEKPIVGKALFKNNINVINDGVIKRVHFYVPKDVTAMIHNGDYNYTFKSGFDYIYPIGSRKDEEDVFITFKPNNKVLVEEYTIFLNPKSDSLGGQFEKVIDDAVIKHSFIKNNEMIHTAGTLTEVMAAAKSL